MLNLFSKNNGAFVIGYEQFPCNSFRAEYDEEHETITLRGLRNRRVFFLFPSEVSIDGGAAGATSYADLKTFITANFFEDASGNGGDPYATQQWVEEQGYIFAVGTKNLLSESISPGFKVLYCIENNTFYSVSETNPDVQSAAIERTDGKFWVPQFYGIQDNSILTGIKPVVNIPYNAKIASVVRESSGNPGVYYWGTDHASMTGEVGYFNDYGGRGSLTKLFRGNDLTEGAPTLNSRYCMRGDKAKDVAITKTFTIITNDSSFYPGSASNSPVNPTSVLEAWITDYLRSGGIYTYDIHWAPMAIRSDKTVLFGGAIARQTAHYNTNFHVFDISVNSGYDYSQSPAYATFYFHGSDSASNICTLPDLNTVWNGYGGCFYDNVEYEFYNFGTVPLVFSQEIELDAAQKTVQLDFNYPGNTIKIKAVIDPATGNRKWIKI